MDAIALGRARARLSLTRAVGISLLLHAAALLIGRSASGPLSGPGLQAEQATRAAQQRLLADIAPAATPAARVPPPANRATTPTSRIRKLADSPSRRPSAPTLTAPDGGWAARTWSSAERAEMDGFLKELAAQSRPSTGLEMSQRALAMARQLGRQAVHDDGEDGQSGQPLVKGNAVEPFSLEMYFDAFIRKLNRSAAFVKNDPRAHGSRKALVQISLNSDGSLKNFRVLRAADQEAEIAYIKNVIDRAAPFSAFPPDIRNVTGSLSMLMCLFPAREGAGSGFSRSFGAKDCLG